MAIIDIAIIVVFALGLILGLYKGLMEQIGSVAGILLGVIACRIWGDEATRFVASIMPDISASDEAAAYVNSVIGNVFLFLAAYLIAMLIAKLLHTVISNLSLGWINRLLGGVFGIVKWFVILSVVLNLWEALLPDHSIVSTSQLMGGMIAKTALNLAPALFGSIAAL